MDESTGAPIHVDLTGYSPDLVVSVRAMAETMADMQDRIAEQYKIIGRLQLEKQDHEVIRLAFIEVVHWIDDGCPPPPPIIRIGIRRSLGMIERN
jgi:hypothetical protein